MHIALHAACAATPVIVVRKMRGTVRGMAALPKTAGVTMDVARPGDHTLW